MRARTPPAFCLFLSYLSLKYPKTTSHLLPRNILRLVFYVLLWLFQGLGVTLDLLKNRAEDALIASLHAYRHIHIINKNWNGNKMSP